jgi:hypothetical protein
MQWNIPSGWPEQNSRNADCNNKGMDDPIAITGCWAAYHGLEDVGYQHLTVGQKHFLTRNHKHPAFDIEASETSQQEDRLHHPTCRLPVMAEMWNWPHWPIYQSHEHVCRELTLTSDVFFDGRCVKRW